MTVSYLCCSKKNISSTHIVHKNMNTFCKAHIIQANIKFKKVHIFLKASVSTWVKALTMYISNRMMFSTIHIFSSINRTKRNRVDKKGTVKFQKFLYCRCVNPPPRANPPYAVNSVNFHNLHNQGTHTNPNWLFI